MDKIVDIDKIKNPISRKVALFIRGTQLTEWYDKIYIDEIIGELTFDNYKGYFFFIVENNKQKTILKYQKKTITQITDWFDEIFAEDFLDFKSNFFIAKKENKKALFFYENNTSIQVTEWYDDINPYPLIKELSNFFIVKKDNKESLYIFNQDEKVSRKITEWFDRIELMGLVYNRTNLYVVKDGDYYSLYKYKDGHSTKIHDAKYILSNGAISNKNTNFYIVKSDTSWAIFNTLVEKPIVKIRFNNYDYINKMYEYFNNKSKKISIKLLLPSGDC